MFYTERREGETMEKQDWKDDINDPTGTINSEKLS